MIRQGWREVFKDDINEMDGYAVIMCYSFLRHKGVQILLDAVRERHGHVDVPVEPWKFFNKGRTT